MSQNKRRRYSREKDRKKRKISEVDQMKKERVKQIKTALRDYLWLKAYDMCLSALRLLLYFRWCVVALRA